MTLGLGTALVIALVILALTFLGGALDLWNNRVRRQAQRERWRKSDRPSGL